MMINILYYNLDIIKVFQNLKKQQPVRRLAATKVKWRTFLTTINLIFLWCQTLFCFVFLLSASIDASYVIWNCNTNIFTLNPHSLKVKWNYIMHGIHKNTFEHVFMKNEWVLLFGLGAQLWQIDFWTHKSINNRFEIYFCKC